MEERRPRGWNVEPKKAAAMTTSGEEGCHRTQSEQKKVVARTTGRRV